MDRNGRRRRPTLLPGVVVSLDVHAVLADPRTFKAPGAEGVLAWESRRPVLIVSASSTSVRFLTLTKNKRAVGGERRIPVSFARWSGWRADRTSFVYDCATIYRAERGAFIDAITCPQFAVASRETMRAISERFAALLADSATSACSVFKESGGDA